MSTFGEADAGREVIHPPVVVPERGPQVGPSGHAEGLDNPGVDLREHQPVGESQQVHVPERVVADLHLAALGQRAQRLGVRASSLSRVGGLLRGSTRPPRCV